MADEHPSMLTTKLVAVMKALDRVPKRGHNDFQNYDYATEADIAAAVRQGLADSVIMLYPTMLGHTSTALPVKEHKTPQYLTTVHMRFDLVDGESGEARSAEWFGQGIDSGDKGIYKAITGAEKYFLLKTFLMPTGDDPEVSADHEEMGIEDGKGNGPQTTTRPVTRDDLVPKSLPPSDGQLYVTDVVIARKGTSKAGNAYTQWRVSFSNQTEASTIKEAIATQARHALDNQTAVEVSVSPAEKEGWLPTLEAIRPVAQVDMVDLAEQAF